MVAQTLSNFFVSYLFSTMLAIFLRHCILRILYYTDIKQAGVKGGHGWQNKKGMMLHVHFFLGHHSKHSGLVSSLLPLPSVYGICQALIYDDDQVFIAT